jgi:DNA-binding CsgD family transcriptional regulator
MISWDLVNDFLAGGTGLHLVIEAILALSAVLGARQVWSRYRTLRRENSALKGDIERIRVSERRWKEESARHVEGLSRAIDDQFMRWTLTPAEKEVALLLLKGMSMKEVAEIRNCSERTARHHSLAIYQKSGLGGRAELSAFFLEDLLAPITSSGALQKN